jgi:DHA1 family bicyclomycin/chloramphenicol resistance-like MFS transporter
VGAAVCAAAAIVAALAPSIGVLIVARLVQGLAGSAAMVIGKAIIRDRSSGGDTTHFLAMTAVGSGALNIFAPIIGGFLNTQFGWRGPLWFIAAMATLLLCVIIVVVPETHAPELREQKSRWLGLHSVSRHLRNRTFLVYAIIQAGSYGTLMAYVASSPFVYQNVLGFDSATFGILFSINAACGVLANFIANRFLRGIGAKRLVMWGLGLSMTGTILTAITWLSGAPVAVIAACITLSMASIGLNGPNLVGLALNQVTRATGSAAATIGFMQFVTGSLISPIVGLWGSATLAPSIIAMLVLAGSSMTVLLVTNRSERGIQAAANITG